MGIVIEAIFSLLQFTFFWLIINIFLSNVLILISEILLFQEPINHELTMKPCNSCHKCCILIKKFVWFKKENMKYMIWKSTNYLILKCHRINSTAFILHLFYILLQINKKIIRFLIVLIFNNNLLWVWATLWNIQLNSTG